MSLGEIIRGYAHRPEDTADTAFQKSLIFVVASSCSVFGALWSVMYMVVFGWGLTAALPLAFTVIVGSALVVSGLRRDHTVVVYAQLICITWISALIQWSIGDAVSSGLVICWSFLGPIGGLIFLPLGRAVILMVVFVGIVVVSFVFEPALLGAPLPVSEGTRQLFFAMNLGVSLTVVFAAATWSTVSLRRALADLKGAQVQLLASEQQATLGRLVAGVLHEMNTPLGVIRSSTQSIGKVLERLGVFVSDHVPEDSADRKKAMRLLTTAPALREDVTTSVERLTSVVAGLKRFANLDSAEVTSIDVRESLDVSLRLMSKSSMDRVAIERSFADESLLVPCIPARLNQVFLSVLENAVEGIDGEGTITVVARQEEVVIVEIRDDGRGIPKQQLADIFEIGFTRQSGRIGMRLGLPMSRRHVEEIGGAISIESVEGKGTTVRIELPV